MSAELVLAMFWKQELGGIGEIRMKGPHEAVMTWSESFQDSKQRFGGDEDEDEKKKTMLVSHGGWKTKVLVA